MYSQMTELALKDKWVQAFESCKMIKTVDYVIK